MFNTLWHVHVDDKKYTEYIYLSLYFYINMVQLYPIQFNVVNKLDSVTNFCNL